MRRLRSLILGCFAVVLVGLAAGFIAVTEPDLAIPAALAVLVVGIAAIDLSLIPVLAVPATMAVVRVGPMSLADFVLGFAAIVALLMLRGKGAQTLQPLLWAGACYIALTAPQLLLNRYVANYIEWAHEIALVLGSMIVGFVVGREGHAKLALGMYIALCWFIGIAAMVTAVSNGFGPVYLGMLHKNAIGAILMIGAIIAFANPPWLEWRPWFGYATFAVCGVGALAAQSRQALIGALVGVLIVGLRPRFHNGKRSRWMWVVLVPVAYFVVTAVQEQLGSDDQFNSSNQRLDWYGDSIKVWQMSPLFGVGHRWWVTGHTGYSGFQPPNAELEVLTTVGVLGLIGFLAMFGGAFWLLAKMNPVYGTLALAVVVGRFAQVQFDLYWVAGHSSILWIIAGICYGVQARDKALGIERIPHPVQTVLRRTPVVRI
ncbi:O-antigen ligase family protein [Microbacterium sp. NPDC055910]|uniref:O-antigen ligase family protein n=1 Tax=Microbacterium sp. NPDC055910 TaxID=3345659 RepID=UPI0035D68D61